MPRLPDDSAANPPPIITLLTDFGASDVFVGSMKGVILGINPLAQIVDLSHDIPAHNIRVAAWPSRGDPIESFGPVVDTSIRFEVPRAHEAGGKLIGEVQHIDRFGNLITNISRENLVSFAGADHLSRVQVDIEHASIDGLQRFYADGPEGTLAALVNSDSWLEIFCHQGRAADLVKAKLG